MMDEIGFEGRRLCHLDGGPVQVLERHQARHRIPVVGGGIPGVKRQRLEILVLGTQPIPVLRGFHVGEGGAGLG